MCSAWTISRNGRSPVKRWKDAAWFGAGRDLTGSLLPVEVTVDDVGRIVLPKPLRDRLGLTPGTKVDVSEYGAGLQVVPGGRTARIVERDGSLVAEADTRVTDEDVFGLIDAGRR
jgi:AbrB family looped-hinge helix DNA binding protein